MPFFFLCLLEDSSLLSNSGFGFFFPLALGAWAAGCGLDATSLIALGASAGFSAAGNGVASTGPTALRPPLSSAGFWVVPVVAPGVRISTPMLFPLAAGVVAVLPRWVVTADARGATPAP